MDPELKAELEAIRQIAEAARVSAEKTRKYILWSAILGVAVIVLPLLFLPFAINSLLSTYASALGDTHTSGSSILDTLGGLGSL